MIGHDYFGTERVVEDLRRLPGWREGLVTITPDDVLRDPETTFISGIRIPHNAPDTALSTISAGAGDACVQTSKTASIAAN